MSEKCQILNFFQEKITKFQVIFNKKWKRVVKKSINCANKREILSKKHQKYNIFFKSVKVEKNVKKKVKNWSKSRGEGK